MHKIYSEIIKINNVIWLLYDCKCNKVSNYIFFLNNFFFPIIKIDLFIVLLHGLVPLEFKFEFSLLELNKECNTQTQKRILLKFITKLKLKIELLFKKNQIITFTIIYLFYLYLDI